MLKSTLTEYRRRRIPLVGGQTSDLEGEYGRYLYVPLDTPIKYREFVIESSNTLDQFVNL